ncbi:methyltransferase domain-containing protein [Celerinatantimonas yamalensis]|uniref:Methyltransferase domain-containing protein n=1 Tax=Celerinatantimonas yamalensis TaxID=559956 RepID=A0ABW9GDC6_9GAMM
MAQRAETQTVINPTESFFNEFGSDQVDIVVNMEHFSDLPSAAKYPERSLKARVIFKNTFPEPQLVDKVNRYGYSRVAKEFTEDRRKTTADFHKLTEYYISAFLSNQRDSTKILEIGPGKGWFRNSFNLMRFNYVSVELSHSMVSEAEDTDNSICSTVREIPYSEGTFDIVVCSLGDPYTGNIPSCQGCDIEAFCAGGCVADAYREHGDVMSSTTNCLVEKSVFNALALNYLS